jgi:hypothetical protein
MRKLLPLVILIAALDLYGQTTAVPLESPQSKIGQFLEQSGTLVQKQITEIGFVRGLRVQAVTATDLFAGNKVVGVRFESASLGADAGNRIRRAALIDLDELDGLIRSIDILREHVFNTFPDAYADVFYTARDGFSAGAYFSDRQWRTMVKLDKYDSNTSITMRPEDFNQLLELLQQAKSKLK